MTVENFLNNIPSNKLANIKKDQDAAFYLFDKTKGSHSFKLVSTLRRLLGIKKVGFSGTLDPLASGLMILATGQATKLLDIFHKLPKTYIAGINFGQSSASFDRETVVTENIQAQAFSQESLDVILKDFLGMQEQVVPIYSAKKVDGQKLNKLARHGKSVEFLPKNKIEIFDLQVLDFKYPFLKLQVVCSAGTYIRSLVNDLGIATKNGALLIDLQRTAIGPFNLDMAIDLEHSDQAEIFANRLSVEQALKLLGV